MSRRRSLSPVRFFRVARPASASTNLAKTGAQIVLVWGFALGVLPALAVQVDRALGLARLPWHGRRWTGAALLGAASAAGLASGWAMAVIGEGTPIPFDAAGVLVIAGPYRVIRNPMVVTALAQSTGIALLLGSPTALTLPVAGAIVWNWILRPPEEQFLADRFGDSYERYRRSVRCWVPRWPPYRP